MAIKEYEAIKEANRRAREVQNPYNLERSHRPQPQEGEDYPGFLTPDEIVQHVVSGQSQASLEQLASLSAEEMLANYDWFPQHIRNRYHLWHTENPHTLWDNPDSDQHPDNLSIKIMIGVQAVARAITGPQRRDAIEATKEKLRV